MGGFSSERDIVVQIVAEAAGGWSALSATAA
jgi:hypothetical protein